MRVARASIVVTATDWDGELAELMGERPLELKWVRPAAEADFNTEYVLDLQSAMEELRVLSCQHVRPWVLDPALPREDDHPLRLSHAQVRHHSSRPEDPSL